MADPPPYRDSNLDTGGAASRAGSDVGSTTGPPRWVKIFGVIALVVVLVFVIVMLTGGGAGHGPARHTPSSSVTEGE
jgi:hypothetical protein